MPKFLVNDDESIGERNDLRCVSIEHKLGIHGSPTSVMSYGDNSGAIGYLVGEENNGLMYMFTMMNAARHAVGLEGMAIAERAYQHALVHARERIQGKPIGSETDGAAIIEHPDVRRMLMEMKAKVEAMRSLAYVCALAYDHGSNDQDDERRARARRRGDFLTPIVKGWCTETGNDVASLGVQIHGGMGYVEETGAAQYLRDARITTIYEGTTGIQGGDLVGRKTIRDGGTAARELLDEISATASQLSDIAETRVANIGKILEAGVLEVTNALQWVLAAEAEDPRLPAAASVRYLNLWGIFCGGWQLAQAAAIAHERLQNSDANASFYKNKIATAEFYAKHCMPQITALGAVIREGSDVVFGITADEL